MSDRNETIKAALAKLDVSKDTDWTDAGLPAMARVKELAGLDDLTREEVGKAHPGFHRQNLQGGGDERGFASKSADNSANELTGKSEDGAHNIGTADAKVLNDAAAEVEDRPEYEPEEIAKHVKNPLLLIEAAMVAMNSNERYRKNGELQNFMRGYLVAQTNIRAHQERLNKRYERLGVEG